MAEYVISLYLSDRISANIGTWGDEVLNLKADKNRDERTRFVPEDTDTSIKSYRSYAEPAQPTEQTELCAE